MNFIEHSQSLIGSHAYIIVRNCKKVLNTSLAAEKNEHWTDPVIGSQLLNNERSWLLFVIYTI